MSGLQGYLVLVSAAVGQATPAEPTLQVSTRQATPAELHPTGQHSSGYTSRVPPDRSALVLPSSRHALRSLDNEHGTYVQQRLSVARPAADPAHCQRSTSAPPALHQRTASAPPAHCQRSTSARPALHQRSASAPQPQGGHRRAEAWFSTS